MNFVSSLLEMASDLAMMGIMFTYGREEHSRNIVGNLQVIAAWLRTSTSCQREQLNPKVSDWPAL